MKFKHILQRAAAKFRQHKAKASAAMYGVFGMLAASPVLAQTSGGNTSEIKAVFDSYKADAIDLSIAFAIVLWTLKGTGLLKPRS